MYLKCEIPFFFGYDRHTLENLTKVMQQKVFEKNEIIYRKGDPSIALYVVLIGEIGMYENE